MELIELRQTSATIQCHSFLKHVPEGLNMCLCGVWPRPNQSTMDRIRAVFAALKTPFYRTTGILSRWRKSGHNRWQMDHQKAMNERRGATKKHEYTSKLDRWQNDEIFRASQLALVGQRRGSSTSTTSSRLTSVIKHLTDSDYGALIPMNKQDHCVNDKIINHQQMLLSAFNEPKAKVYLIFRCT